VVALLQHRGDEQQCDNHNLGLDQVAQDMPTADQCPNAKGRRWQQMGVDNETRNGRVMVKGQLKTALAESMDDGRGLITG